MAILSAPDPLDDLMSVPAQSRTPFLSQPPATKPALRGVSHQVASLLALFGGIWLTVEQTAPRAKLAMAIYGICLTALFAISAAYHRPNWQPLPRQRMRRLDHAGIFLQIAGTYTPLCLIALPAESGQRLLALVWGGALAGIVKTLLWVHAPRALTAGLYVLLGWAAVSEWTAIKAAIGPTGVTLMLTGGVLYTVGAVIYAKKKPSPWPLVFGYHEVFHLLVIAAAACHFALVARL
jgi:hemolysin III